jgi:hypothetical protein
MVALASPMLAAVGDRGRGTLPYTTGVSFTLPPMANDRIGSFELGGLSTAFRADRPTSCRSYR